MTELEIAQEKGRKLNEAIDAMKAKLDLSASKEDVSAAIKAAFGENGIESIVDSISEVKTLAEEANMEITALRTKGEEQKGESLEGIVGKNFDSISKAINEDQAKHEFNISLKATATTASVTSTITHRDNVLSPLASRKLTMSSLFRHISLGKDTDGRVSYIDWDEATTARAAAMVAEGGTFPESTAAWEEFSIKLKKIGDTIPVTEEFGVDQARFRGELEEFLGTNVALVEDDQLLTGDGTGNNLTGVLTSASVHVQASRGISAPTLYDLIPILREGIVKGKGNKFRPDFVMMNLTEINNYKLKKDANENYLMPPFVSADGSVIDGILVIENNNMDDDTLVMGDSSKGRIYDAQEGYSIQIGYVDAQFKEDIKTLKARKRMALLIKNSEKAGFVKTSAAGLAADIAALA